MAYIDEQSRKDQHCCQVDSDRGLEEEWFEVCGGVADHVKKDSWHEGGEDDGQEIAAHLDHNLYLTWIVRDQLHLIGVDHVLVDIRLPEVKQLVSVQGGKVTALSQDDTLFQLANYSQLLFSIKKI